MEQGLWEQAFSLEGSGPRRKALSDAWQRRKGPIKKTLKPKSLRIRGLLVLSACIVKDHRNSACVSKEGSPPSPNARIVKGDIRSLDYRSFRDSYEFPQSA